MEFSYTHPAMTSDQIEEAFKKQQALYFPFHNGWLMILGDNASIRINHLHTLYPCIGQRILDWFSYEYRNGVGVFTNRWDYSNRKFCVTNKQAGILEQELTEIAREFEQNHYHVIQNRIDQDNLFIISQLSREIVELEQQLGQKRQELKVLTSRIK